MFSREQILFKKVVQSIYYKLFRFYEYMSRNADCVITFFVKRLPVFKCHGMRTCKYTEDDTFSKYDRPVVEELLIKLFS